MMRIISNWLKLLYGKVFFSVQNYTEVSPSIYYFLIVCNPTGFSFIAYEHFFDKRKALSLSMTLCRIKALLR